MKIKKKSDIGTIEIEIIEDTVMIYRLPLNGMIYRFQKLTGCSREDAKRILLDIEKESKGTRRVTEFY